MENLKKSYKEELKEYVKNIINDPSSNYRLRKILGSNYEALSFEIDNGETEDSAERILKNYKSFEENNDLFYNKDGTDKSIDEMLVYAEDKKFQTIAREYPWDTSNFEDYQKRVLIEYHELNEKHQKLRNFVYDNEKYHSLAYDEKVNLARQEAYMKGYSEVLLLRVLGFLPKWNGNCD